jgi:hypothetical protein
VCICVYVCALLCCMLRCRMWHPGFHSDGLFLLNSLQRKYPRGILFLAGFSAGSNIVQNILIHNNMMSSSNARVPIRGVFCCCVNYCYLSTMIRLEQESSWIGKCYSWILALQIKVCMCLYFCLLCCTWYL